VSSRGVDQAMNAERPEKKTVRNLWADIVCEKDARRQEQSDDDCLYLTLSGRKGLDIALLVERGVATLTEAGSLVPDSARKVTAVENSPPAVAELQSTFPGLKILEQPIHSVLRGGSLIRFPDGEHEIFCRASVVNLDVNETLRASMDGNKSVSFPLVNFVHKFALLHLKEPTRPWTLLLTLDARVQWDVDIWQYVANYLSENLQAVEGFSTIAKTVWGEDFHTRIVGKDAAWTALQHSQHQNLLLALVPKLIADGIRQHNLEVSVDWGYVYGEHNTGQAPMVTWAISFRTATGGVTPNALYQLNLTRILAQVGRIHGNGEIAHFE